MADPRVRAAVLLCLPGIGGAGLTPFAAEYFPFMNPDFAKVTPLARPAGEQRLRSQGNHASVRGYVF